MAENTKIEWCDHTLNLWWHCVEVSPGCDNCYARELAKRFKRAEWGQETRVWFPAWGNLTEQVYRWEEAAKASGERARIFVESMGDLFELLPEGHPDKAEMEARRRMFFLATIQAAPHLDFLLLTKRLPNVGKLIPPRWLESGWPLNVWLGASVVNQEEADRDIPRLQEYNACVRFLSIEPMLDWIELKIHRRVSHFPLHIAADGSARWKPHHLPFHLVICGGESGTKARPLHPGPVRSLRNQCQSVGIAFFFKQWGEWLHESQTSEDLWPCFCKRGEIAGNVCKHAEFGGYSYRVGKKAAGRLLDGRT